MKLISVVVLSALFVMNSFAKTEDSIDLQCVTEFPTTSFIFSEQGSEVNIQVIHHNGIKYLPAWNGLVTQEDLPKIQETYTRLAQLGDRFDIKWKRADCEKKSEFQIKCFGGNVPVKINGAKVLAWGLITSEVTEKTPVGDFGSHLVELHMEINDKPTILAMKYHAGACQKSVILKR